MEMDEKRVLFSPEGQVINLYMKITVIKENNVEKRMEAYLCRDDKEEVNSIEAGSEKKPA